MSKEYFWDETGITGKTNIALQLVKGAKDPIGPVLTNGAYGTPDEARLQNITVFHDTEGILGTAGRLHCWYGSMIASGESVDLINHYICYAYSDSLGMTGTWVKPNVGKYSVNGNINNNAIFSFWGGVILKLDDPVNPLRAWYYKKFDGTDSGKIYIANGRTPTDFDSPNVADTVAFYNCDYFDLYWDSVRNKMRLLYQVVYYPSPTDPTNARLYCTNEADENFQNWTYTNAPNFYPTTKALPYNRSADDGSNTTPQSHTHMGKHLWDGKDFNGDFILMAPMFFTLTGPAGNLQQGYIDIGLGLMRDFINDDVFQRVRGNSDDLILDRGNQGAWDYGMLQSGSVVETDAELIMFFNGVNTKHEGLAGTPMRFQIGRATWRKDGFTKVQNQNSNPGNFITPLRTKALGELIKVNYNGNVKLELLDAANQIIAGYSKAECTLPVGDYIGQIATWGSNNASELTEFKLKFYLEG